ncbi:uncharacterized protein A1O5_11072 [Cladophialophora psammophila CBS 110553]|uniref:CENP-V/GFA domain-containing protein n=1 Tax=Cladophialophora psammophila CBS 110553 TaxID=1182543 RepID=W9WMI4_9EURO|nr:uncharacterized protein A1O5_11072 [Cladophialophora psammophila CBS 110553]EXJ65831.1 hypothetical protein A1O5_11072 [Cladophialophora psammophila CBS 110553]
MSATTGACLCGQIKYEFTGDIALKAFCNCKDCQRWGGSAGLPNVVIDRESFKVTAGTPKAFDVVGDSGKINRHFFCGHCGSSLYCELEVMPDKTVVKAGSLDQPDVREMQAELYVKDRVSYMKPIEGAKQVPAFL